MIHIVCRVCMYFFYKIVEKKTCFMYLIYMTYTGFTLNMRKSPEHQKPVHELNSTKPACPSKTSEVA